MDVSIVALTCTSSSHVVSTCGALGGMHAVLLFFAQKDFIHIDQDSYRKVQETKKITDRSP
jgi:hypothetical protein